jgi:hypothetical protein
LHTLLTPNSNCFFQQSKTPELKTPGFLFDLKYPTMPKIYESPDGGRTVYQREFNETDRQQVLDLRTSDGRPLVDHLREDQLWHNIRRAAQDNQTIKDLLDQARVVYELSKNENRV